MTRRLPRVRLRQHETIAVDHLVLVAGPAASGKSTFMRALASGSVARDVREALPKGVEQWPQTSGFWLVGIDDEAALRDGRIEGLVLHYDILRPYGRHESFDKDHPLRLLSAAERVTLVELRAPPDELRRRLGAKIERQSRVRSVFSRLRRVVRIWTDPAHRRSAARAGFSLWRFLVARGTDADRHMELAQLYESPKALRDWEHRWREFVHRAAAGRELVTVVVESREDVARRPDYRIVAGPTAAASPSPG